MPSSFDPSVVSSSRCFGSAGAASEELTRSRYSMRCVCRSVRTSLKPAASWIAFDRYPSASSSAFAEARSVSSVMYVFLIHEAVCVLTPSCFRSSFTFAANACAPAASGCGGAAGRGGEAGAAEQAASSRAGRASFMAAQSTRPCCRGLRRPPLGSRQLGLGVADLRDLVARLVGVGGDADRGPAQPPLVLDDRGEGTRLHLDECGLAEEVARLEMHQSDRPAGVAALERHELARLDHVHRAALLALAEDGGPARKDALAGHRDHVPESDVVQPAEERRARKEPGQPDAVARHGGIVL